MTKFIQRIDSGKIAKVFEEYGDKINIGTWEFSMGEADKRNESEHNNWTWHLRAPEKYTFIYSDTEWPEELNNLDAKLKAFWEV